MKKEEIVDRIKELKERRKAIILAHNYQIGQVQDVADYVGDSLGLSQKAAQVKAEVIVFCGVDDNCFISYSILVNHPQII